MALSVRPPLRYTFEDSFYLQESAHRIALEFGNILACPEWLLATPSWIVTILLYLIYYTLDSFDEYKHI